MIDPAYYLLAAAVASAALVAAQRAFGDPARKRARRRIASSPPLAPDSREGEVVSATGIVRPIAHGERFISPLSETRCVIYRIRFDARRGRAIVATPHEETHVRAFILDRGADEPPIIVDGTHAELDVPPATLSRSPTRKLELLRALGFDDVNVTRSSFEEVVVELGTTITVAGTLVRAVDGPPSEARGYRDGVTPTLRLEGNETHPLALTATASRASSASP